jgi:hypothetical protein
MADNIEVSDKTEGTGEAVKGNAIQNASKSLPSEWATPIVLPDDNATEAPASTETVAGDQPRNADGTFASLEAAKAANEPATEPTDEPAESTDETEETEPPAEGEEPAEETPEPAVLVLKGDDQRGEDDIELDVTGLPDEVIQRIKRNENMGLRRKEYDTAMSKVADLEAQQVEVETRLRVNPEGFVLDNLAPATRLKVGAAILLEHWDEFAPDIQALWDDPTARARALTDIKNGVRNGSQLVQTQVSGAVFVKTMKQAINSTIPDGVDPSDAIAYRAAAEAVIAQEIESGKQVSPEKVPQLLSKLSTRYGFVPEGDKDVAKPTRPKLAVINRTQKDGVVGSISNNAPLNKAQQIQNRNAARKVAPQGAGAAPVQIAGPKKGATIQEASQFLRKSNQWTESA